MEKIQRGTVHNRNGQLHIESADEYEHIGEDVRYVMENILQTTNTTSNSYSLLREQFNSALVMECDCTENFESKSRTKSIYRHRTNYLISECKENGSYELLLNDKRNSTDVIYECSTYCTCPSYCYNRLVQFGPRKNLKIIDCSLVGKRFGLATVEPIPKGGFICEYAGEILCEEEAIVRHRLNDASNDMNYIICMNEYPMETENEKASRSIKTFIDASRIANIGRYLNHSCDPNCELISVRVDGIIPKICIFANRDIDKNEELCFSYGNDRNPALDTRKECKCLSVKCKKYLPNF